MDILKYMERIEFLNYSASSKLLVGDYDTALAELAQAYSLQRMLLSHVLSLKYSTCKAQGPAVENSG